MTFIVMAIGIMKEKLSGETRSSLLMTDNVMYDRMTDSSQSQLSIVLLFSLDCRLFRTDGVTEKYLTAKVGYHKEVDSLYILMRFIEPEEN